MTIALLFFGWYWSSQLAQFPDLWFAALQIPDPGWLGVSIEELGEFLVNVGGCSQVPTEQQGEIEG